MIQVSLPFDDMLVAAIDLSNVGIPTPVALAAVALIGYLIGWRLRRRAGQLERGSARRELKRAKAVVRQLDVIAREVRCNLAEHHANVVRFKEQVDRLSKQDENAPWQQLCDEAERVLKPTLHLASQIAHAYDEIRQQTTLLTTFTEVRTDALTGLSNRRALDESLRTMFAMMSRYNTVFSVAMIEIDHFDEAVAEHGRLYGDHLLQKVARLLDDTVRETDVATRGDGQQFVVVMPSTNLGEACRFAQRVRLAVREELSLSLTVGLAVSLDGDNPRTLLIRAETALESAIIEGGDLAFQHNGYHIEPAEPPPAEIEAEAPDDTLPLEEGRLDSPATEVDRV